MYFDNAQKVSMIIILMYYVIYSIQYIHSFFDQSHLRRVGRDFLLIALKFVIVVDTVKCGIEKSTKDAGLGLNPGL